MGIHIWQQQCVGGKPSLPARDFDARQQVSKTPLSMASFHLSEAFDAQISPQIFPQIFQPTLTFCVPSPNVFLLTLEMVSQGRDCGALVSVVCR